MIKYLSLFSGIGAFEKAMTNLNIPFELVAYSEFDKYASKSYCEIHNIDESKNLGDITKIDETKLPSVDFITYGFPCQDISLAGQQKGLFNEDGSKTRSGLFFDALRIIEATKPKVAIAENVKNLTGKKFSEQFELVLKSLEEAGYNNYWKVLNSKDYGIPQNRERVFIVSIRKDVDTGIFEFPKPYELKLRLKNMLEDEVDEKFYLSTQATDKLVRHKNKIIGNDTPDVSCTIHSGYFKCGGRDQQYVKTEPVRLGGIYDTETSKHQAGAIWDKNSIAPTIDTMQGGNRQPLVVDEPKWISEKGVKYIVDPKRGMCTDINPDVIQPLTATGQSNWTGSFVSPDIESLEKSSTIGGKEPVNIKLKNGETITSNDDVSALRIRKLTPKECFRLMGFSDEDFEKCTCSNTQLYKQAGNSIVVDVAEELLCMMFDEEGEFFI